MVTLNPFDLLVDDDAEDPSQLIAAKKKIDVSKVADNPPAAAADAPNKSARLPSKPLLPQAVKDNRSETNRGGRVNGNGRGSSNGHRGEVVAREEVSSNDTAGVVAVEGDADGWTNVERRARVVPRGQGPVESTNGSRSSERRGRGGPPRGQGAVENANGVRPTERRGRGGPRGQGAVDTADGFKPRERRGPGGPRSQGAVENAEDGKPFERRPYRGTRGSRQGGFNNGEAGNGEQPPRYNDRRSVTIAGDEVKPEDSVLENPKTQTDEITPVSEVVITETKTEKIVDEEKLAGEGNLETLVPTKQTKENKPEEEDDKDMTLQEYERVLEERRKALLTLKAEERKVDTTEFQSMHQLANKKVNHEVFIKLGSEKDKKKDTLEKEEKVKKSVSINEFLKPADGQSYYGGRGRGGRGRGGRDSRGGDSRVGFNARNKMPAPAIEDQGQFPTLKVA